MQNTISKPKRSIYSTIVFPTDNDDRKRTTFNRTGDFKSSSSGCFSGFATELNDRLAALKTSEDSGTQTSKTILQLAKIESGDMSPDSLNESPKVGTKNTQTSLEETSDPSEGRSSPPPPNSANTHHPNYVAEAEECRSLTPAYVTCSSISSSPRSSTRSKTTYMAPTISSENKNARNAIRQLDCLFAASKRGRSVSPKKEGGNVDRMERSFSTVSYDASKTQRRLPSKCNSWKEGGSSMDFFFDKETTKRGSEQNSCVSSDNILSNPLAKIKDPDWNTCIQGVAEIIDCCRMSDVDQIYPHMTVINQRLIELLRSPRSHVCRTACQAAGHLFEFVKDTRRPEFDEVVDLLLSKTADANKFIRQDANLALDCMVTHVPTSHAVRALCSKGPGHKNHLVRTATVRLMVCAVVIAGAECVLNPNNSEQTRKKIFYHLPRFVEDKNLEVRKFGERLYKVLSKEFRFDLYLKKYLDKEEILNMKKNVRNITFKA